MIMPKNLNQMYIHEFGFWGAGGKDEPSAQLYTLYSLYCCRCIEGMVVEATSMQTTCGADGKWSHPLPKERSSPTQSFFDASQHFFALQKKQVHKNFFEKRHL